MKSDTQPENSIGAFEARTKLGDLLRRTEAGETFVITRSGEPVAQLSPYINQVDTNKRRRAIDDLIASQRGCSLGGLSIEDLIAEGRL